MAKLKNGGATTIDVEVVSISRHGFWLNLDGRELFVSFKEFPWFAEAPVNKTVNVLRPSPEHLYWPDLDVDLSVESIELRSGSRCDSTPSTARQRSNFLCVKDEKVITLDGSDAMKRAAILSTGDRVSLHALAAATVGVGVTARKNAVMEKQPSPFTRLRATRALV